MKANIGLINSLNLRHHGQKVWLAAHQLKAALTNSPAVTIRAAIPAVKAKPAVIAQTAKPARPASAAVTSANNTTGYGYGELYLNSPAYPANTPIPAISAKPASAEVLAAPAVVAVAAKPAIVLPPVMALRGWSDAIQITKTAQELTVIAELPIAASVGLVGSNMLVIGEITPPTLIAPAWLDGYQDQFAIIPDDPKNPVTLEQYLYNQMTELMDTSIDTVVTDITRIVNGESVACKRLVTTLYPLPGFDLESKSLQLELVEYAQNLGS